MCYKAVEWQEQSASTSTMVNPSCHTRRSYGAPPLSIITVCSASLTRAPSAPHVTTSEDVFASAVRDKELPTLQ